MARHSWRLRAATPGGSNARTMANAAAISSGRRRRCRSDLLVRNVQETVLVEIADDVLGDHHDPLVAFHHVELPQEMIGEASRGRDDVLQRYSVSGIRGRHGRPLGSVIGQVVGEEGLDIDVVVGLLFRRQRIILIERLGRATDDVLIRRARLSETTEPLFCPGGVQLTDAASSSVSSTSRTGFSRISCARVSSSSNRESWSNLMACCSDGVITNRWANFKRSFCSSAMNLAISPCAASARGWFRL